MPIGRLTRRRARDLGAVLAAAFFIAGCGNEREAAPEPTIPRPLAVALADRSAAVARSLDAGDECGALTLAQDLQQQTIAAINTGRVPAVFQEPLQDRVNDLAARIRCEPPAEPEKGKDKKHGHDKGKKKGHKGD